MSRNAEDHARCRASAIPYDYWGMEKEEESRMEDRKEYQQSGLKHPPGLLGSSRSRL
jgi:hypothetical protein